MRWAILFNALGFLAGILLTIGLVALFIGFAISELIVSFSGAIFIVIGLVLYLLLILYIQINKIPRKYEYNEWLDLAFYYGRKKQ